MRDLRGEKPRPIAPRSVDYQGGEIQAVYDIGGVLLTLKQEPPPQRAELDAKAPAPATWALPAAVAAGLVLTIVIVAAFNRVVKETPLSIPKRIVAGNQALAAQGFGSIHFRLGRRGDLEIAGLVTDSAERQRLGAWLKSAHYDDAHLAVQPVNELVEQAQRALGTEGLQVGLHDGRLRIAGATPLMAVKDRVHALAEDLQGTVAVEDTVTYVEAGDRAASPGPLPIRLRGVMIGEPSYFLTDQGARYFVGGVLPDGAEVLAIEAKQIRFRVAGRVVVYNLE
jgi:type III secretion protein D